MAETKDSIFWALVGTVLGMIVISVLCALAMAITDPVQRDSQGIPCTVSTAQRADGSLECQ